MSGWKSKLIFDLTDATTRDATDSVGAYVRSGKAGAIISHHASIKPSAGTFDFVDGDVSVVNNTITETAHGFNTGDRVQLTTTGTLPTGLSLLTDYYVIRVDANTIKLAESELKAEDDDEVDITAAAGGGTHTVTGFEQDIRSLDVYLTNPSIVVTATNLDIRDIDAATDDISSWTKDGTGTAITSTTIGGDTGLDVNVIGGINVEVDLSHTDDSVRLGDGTNYFTSTSENSDIALDVHISNTSIAVTDGGSSLTVDAVNLDIRDIDAATDDISSWTKDGVGTAITSTVNGADTGLDVNIINSTLTVSDAALANTAIANNVNTLDTNDTRESVVGSALSNRKYLFIYNKTNRQMYIGGSSVTQANGFPLDPANIIELRAGAAVDVQWIAANAGHEIRHLELS